MSNFYKMLSKDVVAYYEKDYDSFQADRIFSNTHSRTDNAEISRLLQIFIKENSSILDIGSGSCQWASSLIDKISVYHAIDVSNHLLDTAVKKYGSKINPINCNIFNTDNKFIFLKKQFDTVLFSFFLSHFDDNDIQNLMTRVSSYTDNIIIIDSYQNEKRWKYHGLQFIQRKLPSGDIIKIPKRYFCLKDIKSYGEDILFRTEIAYAGKYWMLAILKRKPAANRKGVY